MTYIKFKVSWNKIEPAKADRLQKAWNELSEARLEVEAEWRSSSEGLGAAAMAQNRNMMQISWNNSNTMEVFSEVSEDHEARRKFNQPLPLGEKTINALLAGKLLSEEQKKALLKRIGVDLDSLSEKAGA